MATSLQAASRPGAEVWALLICAHPNLSSHRYQRMPRNGLEVGADATVLYPREERVSKTSLFSESGPVPIRTQSRCTDPAAPFLTYLLT